MAYPKVITFGGFYYNQKQAWNNNGNIWLRLRNYLNFRSHHIDTGIIYYVPKWYHLKRKKNVLIYIFQLVFLAKIILFSFNLKTLFPMIDNVYIVWFNIYETLFICSILSLMCLSVIVAMHKCKKKFQWLQFCKQLSYFKIQSTLVNLL